MLSVIIGVVSAICLWFCGYSWGRIQHHRWMAERWNEVADFEQKNLRPLTVEEAMAIFRRPYGG